MAEERSPEIYARAEDGGLRLAAGASRWSLHDDHVHLEPDRAGGGLIRVEAELKPFVCHAPSSALVVIDMQNDFCSPGGWTDASGLDYEGCRAAIPGIQRALEAAREHGMWVIWVYWYNRPDLRNLGAPTLYSFKHEPEQTGIGEALDRGRVLTEGSWNAQLVDELEREVLPEDVHVHKFRMSGFWGTHLDQVLRTQGIRTLFFTGVNIDQCVTSTMQDAYFRDYNCVLVEDGATTSSPDYCKQAVVFNAKQCWGFVTTSQQLSAAQPWGSPAA